MSRGAWSRDRAGANEDTYLLLAISTGDVMSTYLQLFAALSNQKLRLVRFQRSADAHYRATALVVAPQSSEVSSGLGAISSARNFSSVCACETHGVTSKARQSRCMAVANQAPCSSLGYHG